MSLRQRANPPVLLNYVELSTRPRAKHALETDNVLRSKVVRRVDTMFTIANMSDAPTASMLLNMYWIHSVRPTIRELRHAAELAHDGQTWEDLQLYDEVLGFLQNVRANAQLRINPKSVKLKKKYDVAREQRT